MFLTRDIVDSILSAYNRFYRNYALESFIKIQKKNLIDLKKSYNLIKLNKMIINYENFLQNPQRFIDKINNFMNLNIKILINLRNPKNYKNDENYTKTKNSCSEHSHTAI